MWSIFIHVSTSCGFSIPPLSSSSHTTCVGKVIDSPSSTSTSLFIKKDTKVDVDHTATVKIIPPPLRHILSHNISLTDYMRLPVEQYVLIPMPLGSSLTTRDTAADNDNILSSNTEFELVVPTIYFLQVITAAGSLCIGLSTRESGGDIIYTMSITWLRFYRESTT